MVNFKAGAHQGEYKRAIASQGAVASGKSQSVSKEEKRALCLSAEEKEALLKRPFSSADPVSKQLVRGKGLALQVIAREKSPKVADTDFCSNSLLKAALVDEQTFAHLGLLSARKGGPCFLCRPGGDFVLTAHAHAHAGCGEILLNEAQRLSLHVCEGEVYEWVPFDAATSIPLSELCLEAQLLHAPAKGAAPRVVRSEHLGAFAAKLLFGAMVTINEIFVVSYSCGAEAAVELVLRVTEVADRSQTELTEVDDEGAAAAADVADGRAQSDAPCIEAHCYRGLVVPATSVFVLPSTTFKGSASQRAVSEGLRLEGVVQRRERRLRNQLNIHTNDGETFPVDKQLLRPCIALTSEIRDASTTNGEASVDIDCATLDRVLLFLQAAAQGRAESFAFDMSTLEDVAAAARTLGYRLLAECCARKLGDFKSRVRLHHWSEVTRHNAQGGCWVTMDGMVFDLEAWLPQHPGGSTIIPKQALDKDCAVFFELYHASRESFQYLREFYIGEIYSEERHLVPMEKETASPEFMQQLKDFCSEFRLSEEETLHAAAACSHLGCAKY